MIVALIGAFLLYLFVKALWDRPNIDTGVLIGRVQDREDE